jgi:hypothetical protein
MSTRAAKATRRHVLLRTEATAQETQLALEVAAQIGLEWRAFGHLTFLGRLRWLATGRLTPSTPNERAAVAEAEQQRAEE